jgi:AraC-like DNA-binding protein
MNNDPRKHYPPGRPAPRQSEGPRVGAQAPGQDISRAQDHWRVNLAEEWEITFWSREFGCTESELKGAVRQVGDVAGDVRAYLADSHQQQRS